MLWFCTGLSAGNQYWVFTESILDPGFPKNLNEMGSGLPRDRIDAALYYTPTGQTFYFRGNKLVMRHLKPQENFTPASAQVFNPELQKGLFV